MNTFLALFGEFCLFPGDWQADGRGTNSLVLVLLQVSVGLESFPGLRLPYNVLGV